MASESLNDPRWWEDPARRCIGNSDFTSPPSKGRPLERLLYLCYTCPVIVECHADALTNPWRSGTIQGGDRW